MTPPRVLMILSQFHPVRGGMENQARMLARGLVERGASVTVLTLAQPGSTTEETYEGFRIARVLKPLALGPLWGLTYHRQVRRTLRARRDEYDVIHCHQVYIHTAAAARAGRELGKPVVCKVVCGGDWSDFVRLQNVRGGDRYLRDALDVDAMVALNADLENEIRAAGIAHNRVARIPNMVDTNFFSPDNVKRNDNELVFVGRLDQQKRVDLLIEGFGLCKSALLTLTLVGDGPSRGALEQKVQALGLADRVRFEGRVADVRPYLRRSAVVVTASAAEGQSNVVLEAMACGAPVLASAAQGNPELIGADREGTEPVAPGKRGWLVRSDEPEAYAEAIVNAVNDGERRATASLNAREYVAEHHTVENVCRAYLDLYARLMEMA